MKRVKDYSYLGCKIHMEMVRHQQIFSRIGSFLVATFGITGVSNRNMEADVGG